MEDKKVMIGGILGIGLLIGLVWFLFFRKGKSGKTPVASVLQPNQQPQPQPSQQPQRPQVVYVNSGAASAGAFPLRQGSRGNEVRALQEALNKAGFNVGTADGAWGANTQRGFTAAFPNKLGVNDLKELETMIADLARRTTSTSATSTDRIIYYTQSYAGYYTARVRSPIKLNITDQNIFDYLNPFENIKLTGRWSRDEKGNIWVQYERPYGRGLAWTYSANLIKNK